MCVSCYIYIISKRCPFPVWHRYSMVYILLKECSMQLYMHVLEACIYVPCASHMLCQAPCSISPHPTPHTYTHNTMLNQKQYIIKGMTHRMGLHLVYHKFAYWIVEYSSRFFLDRLTVLFKYPITIYHA